MPHRGKSLLGAVPDTGHYSDTGYRLRGNMADLLVYEIRGIRPPGPNRTPSKETSQGYPIETRIPIEQDR